jgi:hypothetical protein
LMTERSPAAGRGHTRYAKGGGRAVRRASVHLCYGCTPARRDVRKEKLMRATLIYGAGDIRVENVPDPVLREPTDALVRVVRSCI